MNPWLDHAIDGRDLVVKIDGVMHLRLDRRALVAVQSWEMSTGHPQPVFCIEFTTTTQPVFCQYTDRKLWEAMLRLLEMVDLFVDGET